MSSRGVIALLVISLSGAALLGCQERGRERRPAGFGNPGLAGSDNLSWSPASISTSVPTRVEGKLYLNRNAIRSAVQSTDEVKLRVFHDPRNSGPNEADIAGKEEGGFYVFQVSRENGDIYLEAVVYRGGAIVERVFNNSEFVNDPYKVEVPNRTDRLIGVTMANNVYAVAGEKKVHAPSGKAWPGHEGDNQVRFNFTGGANYDVAVRINSFVFDSPTVKMIATWKGKDAIDLETLDDGWVVAKTQSIPDGTYEFYVTGLDADKKETRRFAVEGSEYGVSGSSVFKTKFASGNVVHPNFNLNSPQSIRMAPPVRKISQGTTLQLKVIGVYEDTATKLRQVLDITNLVKSGWTTTAADKIEVNQSGLLNAKSEGSADIVTSFGGKTSNVVNINSVKATTPSGPSGSTKVEVSGAATVSAGGSAQLSVIVTNVDGTTSTDVKSVNWTSSNTSVATVESGLVAGKSAGSVLITAFSGSVRSNEHSMTVIAPPATITLTRATSDRLGFGASDKVNATISGSQAAITFKSSDTNVATVDANGNLQVAQTVAVNGKKVVITAEATVSGVTVSSTMDLFIYGDDLGAHGGSVNKIWAHKGKADTNGGSGLPDAISDAFESFTLTHKKAMEVVQVKTGRGNVEYYEMTASNSAVTSGKTINFNLVKSPNTFYPDSRQLQGTSPSHFVTNGTGGAWARVVVN